MITKYPLYPSRFQEEASKEFRVFSIIIQSFFQPYHLLDNLLVTLTALTAGSGVGFNRAMLFLMEGDKLKGEVWLGPPSPKEAKSIWELLSTPGMGYAEIIDYNRSLLNGKENNLSSQITNLVYSLESNHLSIPALATSRREIIHVRDAQKEPLVDRKFLETIHVDEFLCIPLLAREEILGMIVLDNAITRFPITESDIELASICGLIAGNYIYVSSLQKKMVEIKKLAAMGEMAMFITHQLRNPLVTIGGFTEQILSTRLPKEKQKRNLQIMKNEVRRLEKILSQLTQFLKVEIKELKYIELKEIITLVLNGAREGAESMGVHVSIEFKEGLPPALCEPVCVGEALRNIIDNALDALPFGGNIFIRGYNENTKWVIISIQDTGKGIPESIKAKIFQAFFSTKEMGMGLGLVYVKRVMEACGGKIEVESEEGKGTLFRLFFRAQERG